MTSKPLDQANHSNHFRRLVEGRTDPKRSALVWAWKVPLNHFWGTQTMELLPHMKIVRKRGATLLGTWNGKMAFVDSEDFLPLDSRGKGCSWIFHFQVRFFLFSSNSDFWTVKSKDHLLAISSTASHTQDLCLIDLSRPFHRSEFYSNALHHLNC